MRTIVLDIAKSDVYDGNGNLLGRIGTTKTEIDKEKAKIYLSINLILEGAKVRTSFDKEAELDNVGLARAIKL